MANPSDDQDPDFEDIDEVVAGDGDGGAVDQPVKKPGRVERIRSSVQSANIEPGKSDVSTKWAIDRLDEREKRFSFAAAGGALLFGTMIYLLETQENFNFSKNPDAPTTTLVLGIVCAGLLLAATFVGRRAPVGFVALFAFLIFGTTALFLGAPFLGLAAWLLIRSYKIQREAAANVRAARAEGSSAKSSITRAAAGSAKTSRSTSGNARNRGPSTPEANKRYTPKRPPPPAPKPSRRERKAAKASD
jgi:hypothetical protein